MHYPATYNVVIIGGGFAGINLVKHLAKYRQFHITLVDKNNYNFFPPLLYQVATGFLETSSISYPYRKLLRGKKNVQFRMGKLMRVDTDNRICFLNDGRLHYDYLAFATGTETNFFGNNVIRRNAIPMKTISDALLMRNAILKNLEMASITEDLKERQKLLTIVVAGGGPTGVEVSGVLAELRKTILQKDYPELVGTGGNIYLVEGSPSLLAQMSTKSHKDAYVALEKLGVKIKLNTIVRNYEDGIVYLSTGEIIETKNLIWAVGVIAKTFEGIPKNALAKGNRMIVDQYNAIVGMAGVYAIGDACLQTTDPKFPVGHPQLAQVAIQQGAWLARNLTAIANEKALRPFHYADKGTMAIMGRKNAVVDLTTPRLHFSGIIALFMWLFIHLVGLVTYRNKMRTFYNWVIAYLTKDQSLRMIIRPSENKNEEIHVNG